MILASSPAGLQTWRTMPRRRTKPLRTRVVYYVQIGSDVVQRATPIVLGKDAPLLFTRKVEAVALATSLGGNVERLTKYRKFKPIDARWDE